VKNIKRGVKMQIKGLWQGNISYGDLDKYIENEFYQIRILNVANGGKVIAEIIEEEQDVDLFPGGVGQRKTYEAYGTWDPDKSELKLSYATCGKDGDKKKSWVSLRMKESSAEGNINDSFAVKLRLIQSQ
jgi:hypothetical protein